MTRIIGLCVLAVLASIQNVHQTNLQSALSGDVLERPIYSNEKRSLNTADAFRASLLRARSPGGAAMIIRCEEEPKKNWNPQGQPLGLVLNDMVSQQRQYRWEVQEGAVNLLPASGEPGLLQIHIGKFDIKTKSTLEALNEVKQRTEVKQAMVNFGLRGGLELIMHAPSPTEFAVRFKGGTLRQALNAIAVAHGRGVWDYREIRCGERNEVIMRF